MKCKNLINVLDENNEQQNFIVTLNLNPEKAVFLYELNLENREEFSNIKKHLNEKLPNTEIVEEYIEKINSEDIEKVLIKFKDEDTFVNLSCGKRIMNLLVCKVTEKLEMKSVCVDIENECILDLSDGKCKKLNVVMKDIEVKDFIESTGGEIISHSTSWFNNKNIREFIDYIILNYDSWEKLKKILSTVSSTEEHDYMNEKSIINITQADENERKEYKRVLDEFQQFDFFTYAYESQNKIILNFKGVETKTLFLKTGTWFEIFVYNIVKEIKEVDDIKSGVVFLWDDEERHVRNEIDVLASINSKLIYISCKDTSKYGIEALNELEVYGAQIGGEEIRKILVATKEPYKRSVILRAKEMGIDIVVFHGSVKDFKKELEKIILS
ncbi:DUF1887 family CARF protein [Clostridium sp. MB40-C1]|uniref:Card1-like endonuclease domain-containing protein n=1 Tax=Clostridium sp. MB40-C1 TaxID=3070996 RepID=UPI0027E0CE37|nr:DUF1887 family CARF protein [Clostridium sp. MB40-C1]WMJ79966.1 DUF1887 family CARF protein [Clostridium sp. MB40-C1]